MKVLDQLVWLGELRGMSKPAATDAASSWLAQLNLTDRSQDPLEEPRGNQQRVQLIGALIHEPDVLVLDEPFSGLDPIAVDALSKVLGRGAAAWRDGRVLVVTPAGPRRGPLRAGRRGRPWASRRRRHDRRTDGRRRPGARDRGTERSRGHVDQRSTAASTCSTSTPGGSACSSRRTPALRPNGPRPCLMRRGAPVRSTGSASSDAASPRCSWPPSVAPSRHQEMVTMADGLISAARSAHDARRRARVA